MTRFTATVALALLVVGCGSAGGSEDAEATGDGSDTVASADSSETSAGANTGPCSVFAQDCPEGTKCLPAQVSHIRAVLDSNDPWCAPLGSELVGMGEPCVVDFFARQDPTTSYDDCGEGLLCWGVDQDLGTGRCERLCGGTESAPECPVGLFCPAGPGLNDVVCVPECDPLAPNCPASTDACFLLDDRWGCYPRDASTVGTQRRSCGYPNDCASGYVCVSEADYAGCSNSFGNCCARLCELGDPAGVCSAPEETLSCVTWPSEGDAPGGYAGLGVCLP